MDKTVQVFADSLIGIRLGTVSSGVVDTVRVEYHGQPTPIKHLAQTGKIQNSIFIDPYDLSIVGKICNALKENGFSAYVFSKTRIMINIPLICGEEKIKISKHLAKLAEESRIAIRNIRKNFRQKNKDKDQEKVVQIITDEAISEIDFILDRKIKSL